MQAKAKKVFALLKEANIADWDVVAQDLRSEPEYESDEGDQIMNLGGVYLSDITSEVSDTEKIGEEHWPNASANAHEKAEKNLKPMGMKINSVDFGEIRGEFVKSARELW